MLAARAEKTPLYPLSIARNWGMGSRYPVVDGCRVLDPSGMMAVLTLDLDAGHAVSNPASHSAGSLPC
ncbi:hypothetical protein DFR70_111190 [Nocardia tenerifensis]|uniref:Uncharacterized protein n=1 Tax=Nocardia tenerifensis TaxID=228006 RepID=A0A318JTE5_9NOCA|nr:hypothetical protein DFR70_111190 [Nocardia tenerifensis]